MAAEPPRKAQRTLMEGVPVRKVPVDARDRDEQLVLLKVSREVLSALPPIRHGDVMGKIMVDAKGKHTVQFTEVKGKERPGGKRTYDMMIEETVSMPMFCFAEERSHDDVNPIESVRLLGRVARKGDLRPRFQPSAKTQKPAVEMVEVVDDPDWDQQIAAPTVEGRAVAKERRSKRPDDEVRQLIFNAFEETPFWSFADLAHHTDQPDQHLRRILETYATMHTAGPHRNLYELRKEFQRAP
eukprot:a80_135.p2 GENE.a80_135~~a80_135.p2  ORF type:complete len:262 (-),score=61.55 a80_135:62-784(-)